MEVIKSAVKKHCVALVQDKIEQIKFSIRQASDSLHNETKSSAGDKYETAREMVQQDLSRYQNQLFEVNRELTLLQNLKDNVSTKIEIGSLVRTSLRHIYVATGAGLQIIDELPVFCISAQSPLYRALEGRTMGETFIFRSQEEEVIEII